VLSQSFRRPAEKTNDFLANDGLWKGNRLIVGPEALYPTLESFFEC
jgi:hypothetical protein